MYDFSFVWSHWEGFWLEIRNRNDIVNILDGAGAKGTFFFSKPPYDGLLSRYWQMPLQTAITVRFNLAHAHLELKTHLVGCIYNADAVDRVKYAYNQGHQVASHTWAHKDLTTLSFDQSMCISDSDSGTKPIIVTQFKMRCWASNVSPLAPDFWCGN